jgi:uncharacterized protein
MHHQATKYGALAAVILGAMAAAAAEPGFDCAKASHKVEQLICEDDALAGLDRKLSQLYRQAEKDFSAEEAARQRTAQRAWIVKRNACEKETDVRGCVENAYRQRTIALQIMTGQVEAPTTVGLSCKGHESTPVFASFHQTDPPSAVLTYGQEQVTAFIAQSGSGSRYVADGVEYWEHQGEATVKWKGQDLSCTIKQSEAAH